MALDLARRFPQISPKAYEHPADRAATAAIGAVPLIEPLLERLSQLGLLRRARQALLGDAVRLGPDQVPGVWERHVAAASVLDLDPPPLYATASPQVNALTTGLRHPVVVVSAAVVTGQDPGDVAAVLAHELGHVLSDHGYYASVLQALGQVLRSTVPVPALAGLPVRGLYLALLEWSRAAELSADRAAAIALGDPLAVCATLMRVAGGNLPGANLQAFLRQATEYADDEDLLARPGRFGVELGRTHPPAVRRVKALVEWVAAGDYDRITAGVYLRRGEEPPVSAELDAMARHYRERFGLLVQRTGAGLGRLGDQLQGWVRPQGPDGPAGPPDGEAWPDGGGHPAV